MDPNILYERTIGTNLRFASALQSSNKPIPFSPDPLYLEAILFLVDVNCCLMTPTFRGKLALADVRTRTTYVCRLRTARAALLAVSIGKKKRVKFYDLCIT